MCDLYGLYQIEKDLATFYESGYFTPVQGKLVKNVLVQLCKEMKDEANGLIDVIAPPDEVLGSPIGASDGDIYNRFLGLLYTNPGTFEKPFYWQDIKDVANVATAKKTYKQSKF
jgi:acyl-CoA oxidase